MTTIDAAADARQRAFRTFLQGLALDVGAALVAVLAVQLGAVEWTQAWWLGLAALAGKTVLTTVVSYVSRKVLPPAPLR